MHKSPRLLMLTVPRLRWQLSPLPRSQTRALRTKPRLIPHHIRPWNPALTCMPRRQRPATAQPVAYEPAKPQAKRPNADPSSTSLSVRNDQDLESTGGEGNDRLHPEAPPQVDSGDHLEERVRLLAFSGNVEQSLQALDQLYAQYPAWDTSVMMTVFRAHTKSQAKQHHEIAKDLYIKMKEMKKRNGDRVDRCDYTSWFVGFLEARHLHYAKRVFRDMINDGCLPTTGSVYAVEKVLKKLHMLYKLGTDISTMTSIALDMLLVLPPAYHGHIFGDWMKAAVVYKAPEVAGHILDMMYQRGTQPETFHFNLLLKALLRTEKSPSVLKAENIGWQMIEEARKSHQRRRLTPVTMARIINRGAIDTATSKEAIVRTAPAANIDTFALIMLHHAKGSQWEHVEYLCRQLQESSVFPNTTVMNVLIDNKCRQGAYGDAWGIYLTLTQPPEGSRGVFPNGATFRHLWKMLRLALSQQVTRDSQDLPSSRTLFREMMSWWKKSRSRHDASRFLQGLAGLDKRAITKLILHCFSYKQDHLGSLVALHALRHYFDIFPTEEAAAILRRQIAWVDLSDASTSVRSQYFYSISNRRNTEIINQLYHVLLQQRMERMGLDQDGLDRLSEEERGEFLLNLLSEFIRVVLKRRHPPEVVEGLIRNAKRRMRWLPTGDLDAWQVA